MAGINFTSVNVINQERENLRKARAAVVEKAKSKYEREERKRQEASARGEDKWMLQSITDRIETDKKAVDKAKKKQKKEKKRLKKEKKKRKEKKKKDRYESSSSDSSDDSDKDDQWIEKSDTRPQQPEPANRIMGPTLQRDSWMEEAGLFDVPTTSRKEIREKQQRVKDEKNAESARIAEEARMKIELNPYWKDGGSGMPEEESKSKSRTNQPMIGDGGVSWLKKSFERCKQQAAEEGRSLEELAAERWGSLKAFEKMLKEAEKKQAQNRRGNSPPRWKRGRDRSRSPDQARKRTHSRSPDRGHYKRSRSPNRYSPSRNGSRSFMRPGGSERSEMRSRTFMKPGSGSDDSRSRSFMKPGESSDRSSDRSERSSDRSERSSDRSERSGDRSRAFMRPSEDRSDRPNSDRFKKPDREESSRDRRQFVKPSDESNRRRDSPDRHRSRQDDVPRWRKKGFEKPRESTPPKPREGRSHQLSRDNERSRRRRSASSSSGESSSSSSESEQEESAASSEEETTPPVTILSEKEMNELGAKILRAEIMGNDDVAAELKAKLEAARKVKAENPQLQTGGPRTQKEPEDVLLTRTSRGGLVQPLPEQEHEGGGGRRRKQKKVATHGRDGERERYFDDDDKHSLKSLVEREKMGTAEDQNAMFARLAGRASEKTDDDYQMDDVIINKAARQQSKAQTEERDRAKAILEHRKMSSAMEKCRFCFDKIPKHLIISIGHKVYLSLPNHRSLTPGHCLIVPMQHMSAGTAVDEDVWQEIQTFRKCLTRMFESREEDVVFMETSMHLKHMPHMCIECVPMERETGDLAPIYFKKAIQDAGPEWSHNKKVVDLSKKDLRHSIPKGFPYFCVDFGQQGGFAHVIEDEQTFPSYFGREIVGGMIDAEPGLWRKPHKESFDVQRKKVLEFAEWWKPFDWTLDLQSKD